MNDRTPSSKPPSWQPSDQALRALAALLLRRRENAGGQDKPGNVVKEVPAGVTTPVGGE
jgi:hypothetical protein